MLKIYGNKISFKVNKVRFVANYLGLENELIMLNPMQGDMKTEEYLKINPVGKMPAIIDGDFKLSESGAIIRYLAAKAKSDLYPEDIEKRAEVDQWIDFGTQHVGAALIKVFFNTVIYKVLGADKDEKSLAEGRDWAVNRFLPIVDQQLAENEFLCGSKISLADLNLLAYIEMVEPCQIDLSAFANISKWSNHLRSQEFYTQCHKNYSDVLMAMK